MASPTPPKTPGGLAEATENEPEVNATPSDAKDTAERKAEANRKKKEKKKERQKAAAAQAKNEALMPSADAVAAAVAAAPPMRSERKQAGDGRGLGMFASEPIKAGEVVASTTPALSVVFDDSAADVCGFCFASGDLSQTEVPVVLQRNASGFGIYLDDRPSANATSGAALIAGVPEGSPNRGAVFIGDRIVSIDGAAVEGGHEGAIKQLRAACERLGEGAGVPAVLSRPSRVQCRGCGKLSACARCVQAGYLDWHKHECRAYQQLPAPTKAGGDTSVLRLLLRFRCTLQPEVGEWAADKESTAALTSLQRNPVNLDRNQLGTLAALTGITSNDAGALISMVRTNACQVQRNGKKAGCALSALVGWHNHDCAPNAAATVMDDGKISVCALRDVAAAEEVLISYVDTADAREARRDVLKQHYGFECRCDRCRIEQRASLKSALKESQNRRR